MRDFLVPDYADSLGAYSVTTMDCLPRALCLHVLSHAFSSNMSNSSLKIYHSVDHLVKWASSRLMIAYPL